MKPLRANKSTSGSQKDVAHRDEIAHDLSMTNRNQNTANLTKQLELESAERKAMEAAKRMARLVGRIGRSQKKEA